MKRMEMRVVVVVMRRREQGRGDGRTAKQAANRVQDVVL